MAQEPATPKWRRAALRLSAALDRPGWIERLRPAASETAALRLRYAQSGAVPPRRKQVSFLIPLVSPEHVSDWDAVTDRLNATLQCLIAQDDPHWHAMICCQERPPLPEDERISWLPFQDPEPGNDKWRKLGALVDRLARLPLPPGYVMSFDADDLLRQGVVREMLTRQAPGGYLVQDGYVLDNATGTVALAGAPSLKLPLRKPFWKLCGSCAAIAYDPGLPQSSAFLHDMLQHEHRMFPYLAALAGQRLSPLSQPSVLYVLNHGENFGARRGRVGFKTRFVERFKIEDPAELAAMAADFPMPDDG